VVEVMDICTKKLILLLMGRTAMSMALRNLNLMRALPKETKKLIRRNGPISPRSAARIRNASTPPLTLTRHLRHLRLFLLPLLPFLPLFPLLLTLILTPTLPITVIAENLCTADKLARHILSYNNHRKNKSKKNFKVKLASKYIPILNDKRPAKERHDRLVELNKPLHRALMHAEFNLNDVQKAGAPHKTAKKVVAEIQSVFRVIEKQSKHLFSGATYGWDKLDNALNHSHLPST
jgi:hypothetical protein